MARKSIQVRLDEKLKKEVESILKRLGIDTPTAIRMFFTKIALTGGIPFDLKDDSYYHYTPEQMKEIDEAYEESLDPKNLSKPYENVEDLIKDLELES